MAIHVTPIPKLTSFAIPAITIGASAAEGDANTAIRSNSTIAGVALITSVDNAIARFDGTAGQLQGYTSNAPTVGDTGVVVKPGQPAFAAILSAEQSNKTGQGATYTVPFNTTRLNQGSVFNTTNYTFTAPVTGQYLLTTVVGYSGATSSASERTVKFITSNLTWVSVENYSLANGFSMTYSIIADMDINDTCTVGLSVNGESSEVIDIQGGSDNGRTNFCGALIA